MRHKHNPCETLKGRGAGGATGRASPCARIMAPSFSCSAFSTCRRCARTLSVPTQHGKRVRKGIGP